MPRWLLLLSGLVLSTAACERSAGPPSTDAALTAGDPRAEGGTVPSPDAADAAAARSLPEPGALPPFQSTETSPTAGPN